MADAAGGRASRGEEILPQSCASASDAERGRNQKDSRMSGARAEPTRGDVAVEPLSDRRENSIDSVGNLTAIAPPLDFGHPDGIRFVIRADLVQLTSDVCVPGDARPRGPGSDHPPPGSGASATTVAVPLPAVKRETEFELRFRSRRQGCDLAPGRAHRRPVYPADPVSALHVSPYRKRSSP